METVKKYAQKFGAVLSAKWNSIRCNPLRAILWLYIISLIVLVGYCWLNGWENTVEAVAKWFRIDFNQPNGKTFYAFVRDCVLALAGAATLIFAAARTFTADKQARISEKRHEVGQRMLANDQLMLATDKLAHESMAIRIGGILSLWELAKSTDDQAMKRNILDMLCAFVRKPVKDVDYEEKNMKEAVLDLKSMEEEGKDNSRLREDVQLVLDLVCKKVAVLKLDDDYKIDFHDADLRHAYLWKADFEGAKLIRACFENANLWEANFEGANLMSANFKCANLRGAHLEGADTLDANFESVNLSGANLENASLMHGNFESANLICANFEGAALINANFSGAHLADANLMGARAPYPNLEEILELKMEQLVNVKSLYGTKLPPGMEEKLRKTHPHLFDRSSI